MANIFTSSSSKLASLRMGWRWYGFVWTPAAIGVLVIVLESTATMSASNTGRWLRPVLEAIFGRLSGSTVEQVNHLIRKSGHFLGYGTLCMLFLRSWLYTLARNLPDPGTSQSISFQFDRSWRLRAWVWAVLSTALVASADEWHQTFLPSRTGQFSDVVLDTCGGILVSGLCLSIVLLIRRRSSLPF
jgi:VanZ family protein